MVTLQLQLALIQAEAYILCRYWKPFVVTTPALWVKDPPRPYLEKEPIGDQPTDLKKI